MSRRAVVLLSCSLAWLVADTAQADALLQRYALIVGANFGGADRPLLKYGISDAERFARVMMDLGGVSPENNIVLKQPKLRELLDGLDLLTRRVTEAARLAGASAGGYGTIWGSNLVRLLYPEATLYVLNDAGIGIGNPEHPESRRASMQEWNATQFVPKTCEACQGSAHLTPWMSWNLEKDPGLKLAMFSAYDWLVVVWSRSSTA